jgi:hypothetical protein
VHGSSLNYSTQMKMSFIRPGDNYYLLKERIRCWLTNAYYYHGYITRHDLNDYLDNEDAS